MAALITPRLKPQRFAEQGPAKLPAVSITPRQKPAVQVAPLLPERQPAPAAAQSQPTQSVEVGEGDIDDEHELPSTGAQNWTIQIGAYATQALAKAELATYAGKSKDVLGRASRLVAPFQSLDGHTLYRARFGPFDERAARDVCIRLSQRGQTCFAALASR
jgi:D-alanyl-D-alanine carboxypeptidase